ncbi:hypothetical protein [Kribbella sp. CA-247076]|uniref:hypothetical protein n=1 Tax=Kribbella sp. CA-247076 TaxID=3239941 RepID=UPI003D8A1F4E
MVRVRGTHPTAFANGEGDTREAAINDLKAALTLLAEEVGALEHLITPAAATANSLTVDLDT